MHGWTDTQILIHIRTQIHRFTDAVLHRRNVTQMQQHMDAQIHRFTDADILISIHRHTEVCTHRYRTQTHTVDR
jgi:hypothetical protein